MFYSAVVVIAVTAAGTEAVLHLFELTGSDLPLLVAEAVIIVVVVIAVTATVAVILG